MYATQQEAKRKDVERTFGVLQSKWHIIARPGRFFNKDFLSGIVTCCVILHNMTREDWLEGHEETVDTVSEEDDSDDEAHVSRDSGLAAIWADGGNDTSAPAGSIAALCSLQTLFQDQAQYSELRSDAIDHVWNLYGNS